MDHVEVVPACGRAALEGVDQREALPCRDGSAEAGHVGCVQSTYTTAVGRHVERGHVAEADEPLRARDEDLPGERVENAHRPVAAAGAEDGVDRGIGHRVRELGGPAGVVAGGVAGAREDAA